MSVTELDTLILRNLRDLDATAQRIVQLDAVVWKEVDRLVETWAKTNGWVGRFDVESKGLWIAPPRWAKLSRDPEEVEFFFIFDRIEDLPSTYFDLADLCAIGGTHYGFRLGQSRYGQVEWKKIVREEEMLDLLGKLRLKTTSKAVPFSPTRIDPNLLADAIETGDYCEALQPITAALDHLANADETIGHLFFPSGRTRTSRARKTSQQ